VPPRSIQKSQSSVEFLAGMALDIGGHTMPPCRGQNKPARLGSRKQVVRP
jgi:hypothetical protein